MVNEKDGFLHQINQWAHLDKEALIPGPSETEEDFARRVHFCRSLHEKIGKELPFKQEAQREENITSPLYALSARWIPLFYSNYHLPPWQGGVAWIFQLEKEGPLGSLIQLRKQLAHRKILFGLYSKEEILAHELVHIARMAYTEPKYEEFFAYQTSPSPVRRLIGPLFQSSWESFLLVFLLTMLLLLDLFLLLMGHLEIYQQAMWLKSIPLFFVSLLAARLLFRKWVLNRCRRSIASLSGRDPWPLLYRLTDWEIAKFARWPREKMIRYIRAQKKDTFRWKLLSSLFNL